MVNRPSVPEIITVNSEKLQTQIRDLLPSQNGFGSELQATNVITPIIDLTATAEGSGLGTNLQTALAFGSNTAFLASNNTVDLAASAGFYRVVGTSNIDQTGADNSNAFTIFDSLASKEVWKHFVPNSASPESSSSIQFDLVFWLRPGDTLRAVSSSGVTIMVGSHRQIATSDGTLVQPSGYPS